MATATLTSKAQITIPLRVREHLRLRTGDQIDFVLGPDGSVTLRPKRIRFERLQGILRNANQKPISVRELDKGIERDVRERWLRKSRAPH